MDHEETLPNGLSKEALGNNLASLVITPAMQELTGKVVRQWTAVSAYKPLEKFGIFPMRQVLFYGPPGNGKTSACQWLAQRIGIPLYRVRCDQLVHAHLGQTPKNVAAIMEWLAASRPAVVLFDEVESLFPARGQVDACSRELAAAMALYWQYLDRWQGRHLFVMATNLDEMLDQALKSRIELKLYFGPPTYEQCRDVIAYWSEALHEYGADLWAKELLERLDGGTLPRSFRELWQAIQTRTVQFVSDRVDAER